VHDYKIVARYGVGTGRIIGTFFSVARINSERHME
jgi:hypothetical protein